LLYLKLKTRTIFDEVSKYSDPRLLLIMLSSAMECPLCSSLMKQHLLQPSLALILCSSESCVYPFNLTMSQLQENNLLIPDVKESDIMRGMLSKMVDESQVNEKIAQFITKDDNDVIL